MIVNAGSVVLEIIKKARESIHTARLIAEHCYWPQERERRDARIVRFRDVCKRDLKSVDINVEGWEELASARVRWRQEVRAGLIRSETKQRRAAKDRRARRKYSRQTTPQSTPFSCSVCGRDCHSRIGPHSHSKRFSSTS